MNQHLQRWIQMIVLRPELPPGWRLTIWCNLGILITHITPTIPPLLTKNERGTGQNVVNSIRTVRLKGTLGVASFIWVTSGWIITASDLGMYLNIISFTVKMVFNTVNGILV